MKPKSRLIVTCGVVFSLLAVIAVMGIGCGSQTGTEADTDGWVNLRVSVGDWPDPAGLLGAGPVDFTDIESFLLTIDKVTLRVSSEDDSTAFEVVFDASEQPAVDNQIDLADLSMLSEIVSGVPVPAGDYDQVRLEISDPLLRLVDDPVDEYRTNIHLTADGRLFAAVDLTIEPQETLNLDLILNDLHLVEEGNGNFVLTPQLTVEMAPAD